VKSLKNCKSPGEDGIVNEVWKTHERLIDYLVEVSNQALKGDVPNEWVDCIIVPVHKKGPVNDPNNYRGIALLSTGGKVIGRVLARRLMQFVVPKVVSESQCGYRPGRSTEDLIFVMRQLLEKAREKNTPMYAVFVDSVDRGLLWEVLAHQGVPSKFLNTFQNQHRNMEGRVSYGGELSERFPMCTGVRQGSVEGPVLFILFLAAVMEVAFPANSRY